MMLAYSINHMREWLIAARERKFSQAKLKAAKQAWIESEAEDVHLLIKAKGEMAGSQPRWSTSIHFSVALVDSCRIDSEQFVCLLSLA